MIFLTQIIKKRTLLLFVILTNILILFFSSFCLAETYTLTLKVDVIESTCDVYGENGSGQPIEAVAY
ncbi:fimbrial protein, partial [Providencia hangzhouensis]